MTEAWINPFSRVEMEIERTTYAISASTICAIPQQVKNAKIKTLRGAIPERLVAFFYTLVLNPVYPYFRRT